MTLRFNALLASSLIAGLVFLMARRAKMPNALTLGLLCFPSPLWQVMSSSNSWIYMFDVVAFAAICNIVKMWLRLPASTLKILVYLFLSLGAFPLFYAGLDGGRMGLMNNAVNAYRMLGAVCILGNAHLCAQTAGLHRHHWLECFSVMSICVFVACMLKGLGLFNTDLLTPDPWASVGVITNDRFFSLGLTRATLGMMGLWGVAAFCAADKSRVLQMPVLAAGAACGMLTVLLVGAKTALASIAAGLLVQRKLGGRFPLGAGLLAAGVVAALCFSLSKEDLQEWVFVHAGTPDRLRTATDRVYKWQGIFDILTRHPLVAVGGRYDSSEARGDELPLSPHFFHNEYLSAFMFGGVGSLLLYLLGLKGLWAGIWTVLKRGDPAGVFAGLVFCAGLIHGLTNVHLQLCLIFPPTVGPIVFVYGTVLGLASRPAGLRKTSSFINRDLPQPAPA
jgi:hypothetical protein